MAAIQIQGLQVRTGQRLLLDLPTLTIAPGERIGLVGHNGAGKSTLLRVISGFDQGNRLQVSGQVTVLGRRLDQPMAQKARQAFRAEVGQVMQALHLVPRLTAQENVLIGALGQLSGWKSWARIYPQALVARAQQVLTQFGLGDRLHTRADRLSGGERQKVSIARLWLQSPRLILADEPTAALDPSAALEACDWINQASPGATQVTVVHQLSLLPALADRILGLKQGRLVFDLPREQVTPDQLDQLYK